MDIKECNRLRQAGSERMMKERQRHFFRLLGDGMHFRFRLIRNIPEFRLYNLLSMRHQPRRSPALFIFIQLLLLVLPSFPSLVHGIVPPGSSILSHKPRIRVLGAPEIVTKIEGLDKIFDDFLSIDKLTATVRPSAASFAPSSAPSSVPSSAPATTRSNAPNIRERTNQPTYIASSSVTGTPSIGVSSTDASPVNLRQTEVFAPKNEEIVSLGESNIIAISGSGVVLALIGGGFFVLFNRRRGGAYHEDDAISENISF